MRLKTIIPIILAAAMLVLALVPLTLAADPQIVPLGQNQSDVRAAYRALFNHISDNGRVHWAQQGFSHNSLAYPAGTLVAPNGLPGSGFDSAIVSGTVNAQPALALDAVGTRVAVFRSTVTLPGGYAVDWELADVRQTLDSWLWGSLDYDILDEADLTGGNLSRYAILIVPSVRKGNEQDMLDKLNPAARANIKAFVENGGFLYAQSNGAVIAEAAGLIPANTVDLANPLLLAPGANNNAGQMNILNAASPLALSWITDTLYLLNDPTYQPGPLNVVAEFTNLNGPNQPAILTAEAGLGRVILVNGHPTAPTRRPQLPVFINAIMWALGHPAELFGDAVQAYNSNLDPHLIPAYDPGAVVSVSLTFANVWDTTMSGVVVTETVANGFEVLPGTVNPAATIIAQTNPTRTLVIWNLGDIPPGEINLSFQTQTGPTALTKGEVTFSTGRSTFTHQGRSHTVSHHPFKLTSRMAARLHLDRDLELDRQYYIPAEGLYLDITVPMENKEDTLASNIVLTDVVLLIAPIVGLDDQETIEDLNSGETIWVRNEPFFYNENTGAPYLPADGYSITSTLTLTDDWDGAFAEFDVPYGTHFCGLSNEFSVQGTGNCVTIPVSYTNYITITANNKLLLPVKVLTWTLGGWPGYHYQEPALRYGIHSSELFSRPVTFAGDPGIVPNQLVMRDTGGTVYTHLGDSPIFYRNFVSSGAYVYTPAAPVRPMISWQDIWSRTHTATLRSTFYDLFSWASCGSCGPGTGETHAFLNVTFGMQADLDGDGLRDEDVLIYPSREDAVNLDIVIKDKALARSIPGNEMVIDLGMFKGLGVQIGPRNGSWYNSYSASAPGVVLSDVLQNSPAYDNLIFQHNVPTGQPVQITLHAVINRYSDILAEGMLKLHDGARFTYRQQYAGPSRYEVYDTHIQGVIGEAPDIRLTKQGTPIEVSTYGDTVYYIFSLSDPPSNTDSRWHTRNGRLDPFLQSYGFGNAAATTYVGGREQKEILHSIVQAGDTTRLRVELNNNTGIDWAGITVTPQPPAGITVSPVYTDAASVPPPIFHDIPFLHVANIPDTTRGVYYFNVQIAANYAGPRGEFVEIPVAVGGSGLPPGFKIAPAKIGIENESGQVYHVFGPAQSLVLTDSLPSYVNLISATIASKTQVDTLTGAADDDARAAAFAALTETITYGVDGNNEAAFNLPGDALAQLYTPNAEALYVVASAAISPPSAGPNWANYGAQATFTDRFGLTGHDTGDPYLVEAHGAAVRVNYACSQVITGVVQAAQLGVADTADPLACALYTDETHQVTLQATVYNDGDYPANSVSTTLTLPPGIVVLSTTPTAQDVNTATNTVTWDIGDLAPGGSKTVEMDVFVSLDSGGDISVSAIQPLAQVINHTDGEFFDPYSDRTIRDKLADDFNLVILKTERTYYAYLPVIMKGFNQQPDLIVKELQVSNSGVSIIIKNIGNASVTDSFWVDAYLNPNTTPRYNHRWWEISAEGLVWGVTQAIPPGGELTLTLNDAYYSTEFSSFAGNIPNGTPVWVQVDSVNLNSNYGGVLESDETNNVEGPVSPAATALEVSGSAASSVPQKTLPPR